MAASLRAAQSVRQRGGSQDPVINGLSGCLPAPEDSRRVRAHLRRVWTIAIVLGVAGILCGGVLAFRLRLIHSSIHSIPMPSLMFAGAFTLGGFVAIFAGLYAGRRIVRNHLRSRALMGGTVTGERPIPVTVEDPQTFRRLKVSPEDTGLLAIHPDRRCVVIEGLNFRYIIHAADFVGLTRLHTPHSEALCIEYRVAPQLTLRIALVAMSVRSEIGRQAFRRKSPLLPILCRGLGATVEEQPG